MPSWKPAALAPLIAGAALIVCAIVFYAIDADPVWLFQSPAASGLLLLAGIALAYLGWTRRPRGREGLES
jgi:hypothetical protein